MLTTQLTPYSAVKRMADSEGLGRNEKEKETEWKRKKINCIIFI